MFHGLFPRPLVDMMNLPLLALSLAILTQYQLLDTLLPPMIITWWRDTALRCPV